jgi:hypothetical protein
MHVPDCSECAQERFFSFSVGNALLHEVEARGEIHGAVTGRNRGLNVVKIEQTGSQREQHTDEIGRGFMVNAGSVWNRHANGLIH